MRATVLALGVWAAAAARDAPTCFTAHEKTSLHCRAEPAKGDAIVLHTDDDASTLAVHWRDGQLCETAKCKRCVAPGSLAWAKCDRKVRWPLRVLAANADPSRSVSLAIGGAVLSIGLGALALASRREGATRGGGAVGAAGATAAPGGGGRALAIARFLLKFAAQPWFPWIAALGTAANMFTLVFTAATVVTFLAAVLARPERWVSTALANAIGAAAGSALLLGAMHLADVQIHSAFPSVFHSAAWAKTTAIMESYGVVGMLIVASLPLILHPVIAFGVLTGMSDFSILAIILGGRTIKYVTMAWVATTAPHALRYFGIRASLFDMAAQAARKQD